MKILLPACFILLFNQAYSQNTFEISHGTSDHDAGNSIRQTFDGKYIVAGSTFSSANGDGNVYLLLIDTNGVVLWSKTYGDTLEDDGQCVRQTPDSGFVIAGTTESIGNGLSDAYLIKTDQNGDTVWTRAFGGGYYDYGSSVENTLDGGYIVVGQFSSPIDSLAEVFMVRTNSNGNSVWTRSYRFAAWSGAIGVVPTPDSGYVVYGDFENDSTGNGDYDLIWQKVDSLGNVEWAIAYTDTTADDYATAIHGTSDGGFILSSLTETQWPASNNFGAKVLRLDSAGDTVWTKAFGTSFYYSISDIVETSDSGFIMTGYIYDTTITGNLFFMTKLSSVGDSLWSVVLDGQFSATGNSILPTSDGGIVACGVTYDTTLVQGDVYVVKTDENGSFASCLPFIVMQPLDTLIEEGEDAVFFVGTTGSNLVFQWQIDSTGLYENLSDTLDYMGSHTNLLIVSNVTLAMDDFHFRCVVTDSAACGDTSLYANLSVTNTIGIETISAGVNKLYPNPSKDWVTIPGALPESVMLFDAFGKVLYEKKGSRHINISSLSPGLYYVRLKYGNTVMIQKLIRE